MSTPVKNPPARSANDALRALREREVPQGVLDGFYDALRERLPHAPPGGAMSLAFLETPRVLRLWRTAAVAAMLVVGVGGAMIATNRLAVVPEEPSPFAAERVLDENDPRAVLLDERDPQSPTQRRRSMFSTVAFPQRFYKVPPPSPPKAPEPSDPSGVRRD